MIFILIVYKLINNSIEDFGIRRWIELEYLYVIIKKRYLLIFYFFIIYNFKMSLYLVKYIFFILDVVSYLSFWIFFFEIDIIIIYF